MWTIPLADIGDGIIALAAVIAAALTIWKIVIPVTRAARRVGRRASRALDVVLGTPAIDDPDHPGEHLRPAVPDIGVRMTAMEDTVARVAAVMAQRSSEHASTVSRYALSEARRANESIKVIRRALEHYHPDDLTPLAELDTRESPDPPMSAGDSNPTDPANPAGLNLRDRRNPTTPKPPSTERPT